MNCSAATGPGAKVTCAWATLTRDYRQEWGLNTTLLRGGLTHSLSLGELTAESLTVIRKAGDARH